MSILILKNHRFTFDNEVAAEAVEALPGSVEPCENQNKIIRAPEFIVRARPVNLSALLASILNSENTLRPEAWVVALASELQRRSALPMPKRWLEKLASALQVDRARVRVPAGIFDSIPRPAWNDSALLGECLLAARANFAARAEPRHSRSGRVSEGCVYTPPAVARAIIEKVHVGARRVVDPACGAGVFLLEAFRRAFARRFELGASPEAAAECALVHEIAGVDVDETALAVAEFSLRMMAFQMGGLTRDAHIDLRHADALNPIAELDGQCDCVVGNPPYVEGRGLSDAQLRALRERFAVAATGKINLFAVFIERALGLLREGGVLALVVPSTFTRNARYKALRELLLRHTIEAIEPLDPNLFSGRVVETCVLRVRKTPPQADSMVETKGGATPQAGLSHGTVLRFCNNLPEKLQRQIDMMEKHGVKLSDYFETRDGISTGFQPFPKQLLGTSNGVVFTTQEGVESRFDPAIHKKIIDGSEFNAFTPVQWAGRYIDYNKHHEHFPPHPGRPFNCQLRDPELYDRAEKLLTRQTAKGLIATVDRQRYFVRNSVHVTFCKTGLPFDISLDALCACFNTRLYSDYFVAVTGEGGDVFPQVHIADLKCLPILPGLLKIDGELDTLGAALLDMHSQSIAPSNDIRMLLAEVQSVLEAAFDIA